MIFIKHNSNGEVHYRHYSPFDKKNGLNKTKEQLEQEGILVDIIPEPQIVDEKQSILYVNLETKELYYKYEDIPPTPEQEQTEKIASLGQSIAELTMAMTMMMGGM